MSSVQGVGIKREWLLDVRLLRGPSAISVEPGGSPALRVLLVDWFSLLVQFEDVNLPKTTPRQVQPHFRAVSRRELTRSELSKRKVSVASRPPSSPRWICRRVERVRGPDALGLPPVLEGTYPVVVVVQAHADADGARDLACCGGSLASSAKLRRPYQRLGVMPLSVSGENFADGESSWSAGRLLLK